MEPPTTETAFLNHVAQRLAMLRREHRLTQHQLAERSGLDRVTIANIETGLRRPTVTSIYRISQGMGIKPDEILR